MSTPRNAALAKLVVGIFLKDQELLQGAAERLCDWFGPTDLVSRWLPFDKTDYYAAEMGAPLYRRLFAFTELIEQESLSEIKLRTNSLELELSQNGKRLLNIDPGYLLAERFVLATGKNFTHRIYIGNGIYADLTLIYQKGKFRTLEWTYPDYADESIRGYLECVRRRYLNWNR